jgi:hypothetical protein
MGNYHSSIVQGKSREFKGAMYRELERFEGHYGRNFRFAFRLRINIPPFASARDLFCICFHPNGSAVPGWAASGAKEPRFFPLSKHFLGHPSLNLLRHPDWFRLAAAPMCGES